MTGERMGRKRVFWDLAICGAGWAYVALALCLNLDSPLLAIGLLILATHELVEPHRHRHGRECDHENR